MAPFPMALSKNNLFENQSAENDPAESSPVPTVPSGGKASEQLATPVQFLKGVGPQRAELLAKLGLFYARDLLFFFPRAYQDMSALVDIDHLQEGIDASVVGTVEEVSLRNTRPGKTILSLLVRQEGKYLRALWYNQPWLKQKFQRGRRLLLSGTPKLQGLRWEMNHPAIEFLADDEDAPTGRIMPVYPLTEGINQPAMRRMVHGAVDTMASLVDEVFPLAFLDDHALWPIRAALPQIHQPSDHTALEQARRRFIYQELFVLQLALALRKAAAGAQGHAVPLETTAKIDARIRRLFPFDFTAAQDQAIHEICQDVGQSRPMNRLLQGDVGSGKTAVAQYAILLAIAHGCQTAMMAPTEILARQHFHTMQKALAASRVRVGLLVGSLSAQQRRDTLRGIERGEIDLVVGTHAISSGVQTGEVAFNKLGLVVIDEQHKFGVAQRQSLKQAGLAPHYLVMTATPIPRTVTMTMFGDLELSTLREPPPGRKKINTYVVGDERRERWWSFFRKKLREGRQGYVIAPLVEEDDNDLRAGVEQLREELARDELADFKLGLVHGRMTTHEKDQAMELFRRGQTKVLVATSVIEVGIDVPNATLMTIEGGESFGLSQLHQLRGRIGRGQHAGYCCIFARPQTEEATKRLEALAKTTDGFALAEVDFALRGPGNLFGTRQHGLPPLRIADLIRDAAIVEEARRDALALVAADSSLSDASLAKLKKMVLARYGDVLELGDVG
jgi:ATP-dependent DNA helicase RecG